MQESCSRKFLLHRLNNNSIFLLEDLFFFSMDGRSHYFSTSQTKNITVQNILQAMRAQITQPPRPTSKYWATKDATQLATLFTSGRHADRHYNCKTKSRLSWSRGLAWANAIPPESRQSRSQSHPQWKSSELPNSAKHKRYPFKWLKA